MKTSSNAVPRSKLTKFDFLSNNYIFKYSCFLLYSVHTDNIYDEKLHRVQSNIECLFYSWQNNICLQVYYYIPVK